MQDIYQELSDSLQIWALKERVIQKPGEMVGYVVKGGHLWYKNRLVLPKDSRFKSLILHEYHTCLLGGHSGMLKTMKRIQQSLYWSHMLKDIQQFVAEYGVCQTHKYSTLLPAGLLQPLPIPNQIWEDVSMDFVEGLPTSYGVNTILVVVDRLSKYGHFIGLKHHFHAMDVVLAFNREVVRLHGYPS